jgi:HSP20 family protein
MVGAAMASVFRPFQEVIGELGRDLVMKPLGMASQMVSRIRLEVDEDDGAYTVRAEMPGVRKEDIRLSIDGNQISLSAELRRESPGRNQTLYSERSYGTASRTFLLPAEVDSQGAAAQYQDGVLTVVVPKKSAASGSRVPIS